MEEDGADSVLLNSLSWLSPNQCGLLPGSLALAVWDKYIMRNCERTIVVFDAKSEEIPEVQTSQALSHATVVEIGTRGNLRRLSLNRRFILRWLLPIRRGSRLSVLIASQRLTKLAIEARLSGSVEEAVAV
jgi:hypothetical protein